MVGLGSGPAPKVKEMKPPYVKPKGKPRVVSATKITEILTLLQDILDTMRLPVHQHERLARRIKDLRNGS